MVIIKLWGGLGNQMFQYSYGYCLARKMNTELVLDIGFYSKQPKHVTKRTFRLNLFQIEKSGIYYRSRFVKITQNVYINKIIRIFPRFAFNTKRMIYIKETRNTKIIEIPKYEKDIYIDGYWQSSLYFNSCKESLINQFQANFELSSNVIYWLDRIQNDSNSIAIHVRRGDFLVKKNGFLKGELYYINAIQTIEKIITNPKFYVFSDDIEWTKKTFGVDEKFVYVQNNGEYSDIEDLMCIKHCKHSILSASTFSWWGAWLRNSSDSIVIAPKGFYFNSKFVEPDWIQL